MSLIACYDCDTRRPEDVMRETTIRVETGRTATVLICPRCDNRRSPQLSDFTFTPASGGSSP